MGLVHVELGLFVLSSAALVVGRAPCSTAPTRGAWPRRVLSPLLWQSWPRRPRWTKPLAFFSVVNFSCAAEEARAAVVPRESGPVSLPDDLGRVAPVAGLLGAEGRSLTEGRQQNLMRRS